MTTQSYHGLPDSPYRSLNFFTWSLWLLLRFVIPHQHLPPGVVENFTSFFRGIIEKQSGVVGFAPGILGDADDTACNLLTLYHLGTYADLGPMIEKFRSGSCFRTCQFEGNPSLSANCSVVLALIFCDRSEQYSALLQQVMQYLITIATSGEFLDKWSLSPRYSSMLLVHVLTSALEEAENGCLKQLSQTLARHGIPISICQILSKHCATKKNDGSSSHSLEETAYGSIILA